jgi:carboxypeptidase Q
LRGDDLRQAAVVMAGMLLAAANSDAELPRPPLPTQPAATDPFKYDYPASQ